MHLMEVLTTLLALICSIEALNHRQIYQLTHMRQAATKASGLQDQATTPPTHFFDQLIDHSNPSLGTFKQRYWINTDYWTPGGPAIFFDVGETNADGSQGYIYNDETGFIGKRLGGIVVVAEHRYYGLSNPVPNLSGANMKYLTMNQSIEDTIYFIKNVKIPIPTTVINVPLHFSLNAPKYPWLIFGSSYPGMKAAYAKHHYPDVVLGAQSASAPVEAILNFWTYYKAFEDGAPKNCTSDLRAAMQIIDSKLHSLSDKEWQDFITPFGMRGLTYRDDFASAMTFGPGLWQNNWWATKYNDVYIFCDAIELRELSNGTLISRKNGWGANQTLIAWANYMMVLNKANGVGTVITADNVWGTHNASSEFYTDTSLDQESRSWMWQMCRELGFWQNGPPLPYERGSNLISRALKTEYWERQCKLMFGSQHLPPYAPVQKINEYYGGWRIRQNNIFWINGQFDPWRAASVDSNFGAPPRKNERYNSPNFIIPNAVHEWNLWNRPHQPEAVTQLHAYEVKAFTVWTKKFWAAKGIEWTPLISFNGTKIKKQSVRSTSRRSIERQTENFVAPTSPPISLNFEVDFLPVP